MRAWCSKGKLGAPTGTEGAVGNWRRGGPVLQAGENTGQMFGRAAEKGMWISFHGCRHQVSQTGWLVTETHPLAVLDARSLQSAEPTRLPGRTARGPSLGFWCCWQCLVHDSNQSAPSRGLLLACMSPQGVLLAACLCLCRLSFRRTQSSSLGATLMTSP